MTTGAVLFMVGSWVFVLGLMGWSFWRILRVQRNRRAEPISDEYDGAVKPK